MIRNKSSSSVGASDKTGNKHPKRSLFLLYNAYNSNSKEIKMSMYYDSMNNEMNKSESNEESEYELYVMNSRIISNFPLVY